MEYAAAQVGKNEASVPQLTFTEIRTRDPERAGKFFTLNADGTVDKQTVSAVNEATAITRAVEGIAGFAEYLEALDAGTIALTFGVPKAEVPRDGIKLLSQARKTEGDGAITRTKDAFAYTEGPGIAPFDYDPPDEEEALDRKDLVKALAGVAPEIGRVELIWWMSSGSNIYLDDGTEAVGLRGQRLYLPVADMSDWPRAFEAIWTRLVNAGHGRIQISAAGVMLERTLFDKGMKQAERLDFAAGAVCGDGLRQDRGQPKLKPGELDVLDTRAVIPDLTPDEIAECAAIFERLKAEAKPEADRIRDAWAEVRVIDETRHSVGADASQEALDARVAELKAQGRKAEIMALASGEKQWQVLPADTLIALGRDQVVTVREMLMDPASFERKAVCDPIEPDYNDYHRAATVWASSRTLHTHAHGANRNYTLGTDAEFAEIVRVRASALVGDVGGLLAKIEAGEIGLLSPDAVLLAWHAQRDPETDLFARMQTIAGGRLGALMGEVRGLQASLRAAEKRARDAADEHASDGQEAGQSTGAGDAWLATEEPEPYDPFTSFAAPPCPMDTLPPVIREYAEAAAINLGVDPAGIAVSLLTAAGSAAGNVNRIKIKPGWSEPATLWTVLVGGSGSKKSPIQDLATKPLYDEAKLRHAAYERELAIHKANKSKEAKAHLKEMGLTVESQEPEPPAVMVSNNATLEAAADAMIRSRRGFLMHHDELTSFLGSLDRTSGSSKSGGNVDRGFWLSAWNGNAYTLQRVKRGVHFVPRTAISMLAGTQPRKLVEMKKEGVDLDSDGLAQRFAYVFLDDAGASGGWEAADTRFMLAQAAYGALMLALMKTPTGDLIFDADAKEVARRVAGEIDDLARTIEAVDAGWSEWTRKAAGLVMKLAGILRLIEGRGQDRVVCGADVSKAERLVREYFLFTARGFFCEVATGERPAAMKIAEWLLTSETIEPGRKVTMAELKRGPRVLRNSDAYEIRKKISPLVAGGWLRPCDGEFRGHETAWLLNSQVRQKFSEQAERHRKELYALSQKLQKHGKGE